MKYMHHFVAMALFSLVLFSCEDGEDMPLTKLEGTYTGTFQRTVGNERGRIANVTFSFDNTSWEGFSDTYQYPALCMGTYQVKEQIIHFQNNCMFTADFDWTLILSGNYEINQTGNALTFTKVYLNADALIKDVYSLQISEVK